MTEVVVRGGTVITPDGGRRADVAIENGRIVEIGTDLAAALEEIDATGLAVLPAMIDVHLHFNEPGRTEWEGAASGSRALAAGGGTLFFDMPLNSTPCTINPREFDRKRAALEAASVTDFAMWGGLVPGSVAEMAEMAGRGVVGFKAFMCDSGLPEFPRADDATLLDGLKEAATLGLPVAVHAESQELTAALARRATGRSVRDFLCSRPMVAELEAIQRALLFAGDTGARLHIVHISSGRGVAMAAEARARGVDVSIETCAHYLWFTEDDVERLGAVAKCAPPLRPAADRQALWDELVRGRVDIVSSDHSPTEPAMKRGDFMAAWGGIAGVQSTLPVLLDRGCHARGLPLTRIAELVATGPARRFRIAGRGSLVAGNDADLVLVDPAATFTLKESDLHQRHKASPYVGASFRGKVRRTIRRGETIFLDGRITAQTKGHLVRPSRAAEAR
ncbi:MAG TPA: allantoinase AllB [Vicinamibacterales bacterium]